MDLKIDDSRLKEILEENNDKVYLVDFYAEWCGPCRTLAPVLETLTEEYLTDDSKEIVKINVDDIQGNILETLTVRNIPTMIFFKNGQEINRLIGSHGKNVIAEAFDHIN